MPAIDPEEVQRRFDEAAKLGVTPCAWLPPEWARFEKSGKKFEDTPPDLPLFEAGGAEGEERVKKGQEIDKRAPDGPDCMPSDDQARKAWVSPFTDFTHVDDREFSRSDVDLISSALKVGDGYSHIKVGAELLEKNRDEVSEKLKKKDQRRFDQIINQLRGMTPGGGRVLAKIKEDLDDGPIAFEISEAIKGKPNEEKHFEDLKHALGLQDDALNNLSAVNRLKHIVGADTVGMKRLERVFEWVLYRTTELLRDLNDSAKKQEDEYTEARENYIEFLKDLDDHEPVLGRKRLDPCGGASKKSDGAKLRKSGYGITIKWTCLHPVIKDGRIIGARVICQWNPHSSSSGIGVH